jgi:hypothetical protein
MSSPREEYASRLERWAAAQNALQHRNRQLSNARLAIGLAAVAIAALSIGVEWISPWWLLAPLGLFIALAIRHDRVDRELQKSIRAVAYYTRAQQRSAGILSAPPSSHAGGSREGSLYAGDLDIFGPNSLFELLNAARTSTGERTLENWLLSPALITEATARQQAVAELRPRLDLREQLALLGSDIRAAIGQRSMSEWGTRPPVHFFRGARWIALLLALAAVGAIIAFFAGFAGLRLLFYVFVIEGIFGFFLRDAAGSVVSAIDAPASDLRLIALLLGAIERESFTSPGLRSLQQRLTADGQRATEQIHRLERLVDRLDWARNQFFRVLAAPLLWVPQCAIAIEAWRNRCGHAIGDWILAVGEFEALLSLATFAYERPDATFPELDDSPEPFFRASALSHPLIPAQEAVPNDVDLGGSARLWIVSGSNMSGKSTLLRAVGLNTVLAWAGAPVTASALRLSRLEVGASLRTNDSLADHRSRFYAEISRLRDIVDLAGRSPTLYLLDELLSGTNSHDRRIGAEAILRGLVERGAIGMATTHDLALAEIAAALNGRAINVHFEDHLEGTQIRFDYRLKRGVVARSNALALMRAVGLEV